MYDSLMKDNPHLYKFHFWNNVGSQLQKASSVALEKDKCETAINNKSYKLHLPPHNIIIPMQTST